MDDHCNAELIWNERTRTELREALKSEEKILTLGRTRVAEGSGGYPSWNYNEFSVKYQSISRFLCIGNIFIKLLLENVEQGSIEQLQNPKDFFNALYHKFLCEADHSIHLEQLAATSKQVTTEEKSTIAAFLEGDSENERELCIRAMACVYSIHAGILFYLCFFYLKLRDKV